MPGAPVHGQILPNVDELADEVGSPQRDQESAIAAPSLQPTRSAGPRSSVSEEGDGVGRHDVVGEWTRHIRCTAVAATLGDVDPMVFGQGHCLCVERLGGAHAAVQKDDGFAGAGHFVVGVDVARVDECSIGSHALTLQTVMALHMG